MCKGTAACGRSRVCRRSGCHSMEGRGNHAVFDRLETCIRDHIITVLDIDNRVNLLVDNGERCWSIDRRAVSHASCRAPLRHLYRVDHTVHHHKPRDVPPASCQEVPTTTLYCVDRDLFVPLRKSMTDVTAKAIRPFRNPPKTPSNQCKFLKQPFSPLLSQPKTTEQPGRRARPWACRSGSRS